MRSGDERGGLVGGHDGRDVEQAEAIDGAGTAVDAVGIGDGLAEHLVAAAQAEHMAAAANMRQDVDVPALRAQEGEIADGGFAAGQNDDVGIGGNWLARPDEDELDLGSMPSGSRSSKLAMRASTGTAMTRERR